MRAEGTGSVDIVSQSGQQNFAFALKLDLFPGLDTYRMSCMSHISYYGKTTHISPSLSSASLRTAMVFVDIVRWTDRNDLGRVLILRDTR